METERCGNPSCQKELDYGDGVPLGVLVYCKDCAAELIDLSVAEQIVKAFWWNHPNALFEPKATSCDDCRKPWHCQLPIICGYKELQYLKRIDPDFFAKLEPLAKELAGRIGG